jgi:hypothetical protein
MPLPLPHYQPQFTPEHLAVARKVAAQTSAPLRAVQRARLALLLAAHPDWSHNQIGAACGLREQTVYKWRRRWTTQGFSLDDAPRSGRPLGFPP